jgi:hypothetical protein
MIATILKSSATFSAVEYNERKVSKGTAELLEIKNFDMLEKTGNISMTNLRNYLIKYSSQNENIKNTQFHLAISCKKDEYSYEELVKIAHQYLDRMGYGDSGQPLLIYAHHDTANNHIHIITSRVAPDGQKISDHNERLRSQAIINSIMGIEPKQEAKSIIQQALAYSFETLGQFQAILESGGYESYIDDEKINVKKGGTVLDDIPIEEVKKHFRRKPKEETDKRKKQLKAIILKYQRLSANKEELNATLKKKFGVNIVFVGKKDTPYGYMLVDHKEKAVYKGNEILQLKELLKFPSKSNVSKKEQKEEIPAFVHQLLEGNGKLTIGEINRSLWRKYAVNIYHDGFIRDKRHRTIAQVAVDDYEILRHDFRKEWLQRFNPSTEEERTILCRFGHIEDENDIQIVPDRDRKNVDATIAHINEILNTAEKGLIYEELNKSKIIIIRKDEALFAIDMGGSTIVNLRDTDIDLSKLIRQGRIDHTEREKRVATIEANGNKASQSRQGETGNVLRPTSPGHHANREWEVGEFGNWDDVDDERKLRR